MLSKILTNNMYNRKPRHTTVAGGNVEKVVEAKVDSMPQMMMIMKDTMITKLAMQNMEVLLPATKVFHKHQALPFHHLALKQIYM